MLGHKALGDAQPVTLSHGEALAGRRPHPVDCAQGVEEHEGAHVSAAHRRVDPDQIVLSNEVFNPIIEVRERGSQPQRCCVEALWSPNAARGRLDGVFAIDCGRCNDAVEVGAVAVRHDRDAA